MSLSTLASLPSAPPTPPAVICTWNTGQGLITAQTPSSRSGFERAKLCVRPRRGVRATMSALQQYVDQRVLVITQDGRVIVGTLRGSDAVGSIILAASVERIFSPDEGVEEVPLGLYILRGDAICLVGLVDVEKDKAIDLATLMAEPIPETRHA
ncbi:LSM-domain-containing protein [Moesziomyces antarcticus]|uniref:LSM2-LSM8 complex subunit LSM8 n=2 Tax=Pseudozyma antarctica TaxID=84753 RepID=A0A081CDM2_PSEA2|nr:LSM-domain-containing protein [Moesziomyces antarcticus]GAK64768.1 LSM-domain-containing protein [Moesziomyces antarcticus]